MDGSSFLAAFSSDHEIRFDGGAIDTYPVSGSKVTVFPSPENPELSSPKLNLKNIVNFGWDNKYHHGQLVSHHKGGDYFAYCVLTPGIKNVGVVRIVNRISEERVLVKGMEGVVKDLSFSHDLEKITLGVVDEFANVFIFLIEEHSSDKSLGTQLILQINSKTSQTLDQKYEHLTPRIIWCPRLIEEIIENDPNDIPGMFVLTKGNVAEVYNSKKVINAYTSNVLDNTSITVGKLKINDFKGPITDAVLSPDGSTLAAGSVDGNVKFFQIYMHSSETPRCLHQWTPHGGQPISSIFFLDNHIDPKGDQFWKMLVTGANWNSEFKIWCCQSWSCHQTLKFSMPSLDSPRLRPALDLSAKFLLLSDIERKNLYVIKFDNVADDVSTFVSVSEFATPTPFLSMAILEAGAKIVKANNLDNEDENLCSYSDEEDIEDDLEDKKPILVKEELKESTVIKVMLVQPKSLQECTVIYEDLQQHATVSDIGVPIKLEQSLETYGLNLSENLGIKRAEEQGDISTNPNSTSILHLLECNLTPVKTEVISPKAELTAHQNGQKKNGGCALQKAADKITLMSPEMFETKPIKEEVPQDATSTPQRGAAMNYLPTRQLLAGASGTSSPSREVADILGTAEGDDEIDLNVEYVVTEENDDDDDIEDDDDDIDDDDSDNGAVFDEIALKKEEEEFANLDKILTKQEIKSEPEESDSDNEDDPLGDTTVMPSPAACSLPLIKQESIQSITILPKLEKTSVESSPQQQYISHNQNMLSRSFDHAAMSSDAQLQSQMAQLLTKMNDMTSLIQTQRAEIQILKEEFRAQHSQEFKDIESILQTGFTYQSAAISEALKRDTKNMATCINQSVHATLTSQVEREMAALVPKISKLTAEALKRNLSQEVQSQVLRADEALKDGISKMSQSKPVIETLGRSLAQVLQPVLQNAFRELFINIVVPGFERGSQSLLHGLSTTLNQGCKDYEAHLRQNVGRQLEPMTKEIRDVADKLVKQNMAASQNQNFDTQLKALETRILSSVKDVVAVEVRQALAIQAANISRSLSATPTMSPGLNASATSTPTLQDHRSSVQKFLNADKINEAFQCALMANNLPLVVATCERIDPSVAFSQKYSLSQGVILSLIQQLSVNLEEKAELKLAYLQDAVMNLNSDDPSIRTHVKIVIPALRKQLERCLSSAPDSSLIRPMKMLLMATQGFGQD